MPRQSVGDIAVPVFGYKNHLGIDRTHGFIRRFIVTHAARHDGSQLAVLLDPDNAASGVWADTAYRSKANLRLLDRRRLVALSGISEPLRRSRWQISPTIYGRLPPQGVLLLPTASDA